LVRLTFNQVANSIRGLLGDALADDLTRSLELPSPFERTFPPLNNPREGAVITDAQWQTGDAIADGAGQYLAANFATITDCGDDPTQECARGYLADFAQGAYRRPLTSDEQAALM